MYGDKIMQTLVSILTEGEEPKKPEKQEETSKLQGSVLDDQIVALMSGRPSEEIKNLKGKAEADPAGLLKSVGITGLPSGGSKIKNLESMFEIMISGQNVGKDSPAQYFKNIFDTPEIVKSPNGTAPGLLIRLTPEAKTAISKTASTKKSLRVFAFWFASIVTALNNTKPNYFDIGTDYFKFQYASGQQALLIYVSKNKSWRSL